MPTKTEVLTEAELAALQERQADRSAASGASMGETDRLLATIDARDREIALLQQMCAVNGGVADRSMGRADDSSIMAIEMADLAEAAWGIIANASGGDWSRQNDEWVTAAQRWRERYHALVIDKVRERTP